VDHLPCPRRQPSHQNSLSGAADGTTLSRDVEYSKENTHFLHKSLKGMTATTLPHVRHACDHHPLFGASSSIVEGENPWLFNFGHLIG
jgi:hypothetical protein